MRIIKLYKNVLRGVIVLCLLSSPFGAFGVNLASALSPNPELVSAGGGQYSNGSSSRLSVSNDGRYVLFRSNATNLLAGQNISSNSDLGVAYVRDRVAGTTVLASVNSLGEQQNGYLSLAVISGDGRYVFFSTSDATNMGVELVHPTGYGYNYLYRHDLVSGQTVLVSLEDNGTTGTIDYLINVNVSDDGNYVVYDGIMHDVSTQTNISISGAYINSVSGDGSKITYSKSMDGSPSQNAIFVRDLSSGQDTLVYEHPISGAADVNFLNGNGDYVLFQTHDSTVTSDTPGLCDFAPCSYRFNVSTGQTQLIKTTYNGATIYPDAGNNVSSDGNYLVVYNAVQAGLGGSNNYEYITIDSPGLLLLTIDTGASYYVGYGPDWAPPASPAVTYNEDWNSVLTGDGSELVFLSSATNFGVPENCDINMEGTITHQQCVDVYTVSTEQNPNVVSDDITPPVLSTPVWSQDPKPTTGSTTMTVSATDNLTGISGAEYFIGDTDPGQGNGATMTLTNQQTNNEGAVTSADLTTIFGSNFPTGVYKISVRAQDVAGNWSEATSDYLVVYDVNGPKFKGKKTIIPNVTNGDVLPGLISSNQTDKADFGFIVKYNNQGQISNNSDLQFTYSTGRHCNNPNKADNCHDLSLNATHIDWMVTQDTNNSIGIFQGTADLTVDGQTTSVLFRITGRDGERMNPTATDQFQLQIFNLGDNPNTATPICRVNSADINRGNIKIVD